MNYDNNNNEVIFPEDICVGCSKYTWNQDHQDRSDDLGNEERVCHHGHVPQEDDQGAWCPHWERFNLAQG